jgi:hypothetical protein
MLSEGESKFSYDGESCFLMMIGKAVLVTPMALNIFTMLPHGKNQDSPMSQNWVNLVHWDQSTIVGLGCLHTWMSSIHFGLRL